MVYYMNGSLYIRNRRGPKYDDGVQRRLSWYDLRDKPWWDEDRCSLDDDRLAVNGVITDDPLGAVNDMSSILESSDYDVHGSIMVSSSEDRIVIIMAYRNGSWVTSQGTSVDSLLSVGSVDYGHYAKEDVDNVANIIKR
jgi:hypothetical protein